MLMDPTYTSFCDVSATVSCTQAYLSRYGSLMGVPVAVLGLIFFTVVGLMVAFAPGPRPVSAGKGKKARAEEADGVAGENVPAYVFALSAIGVVFTLYLAWASLFQLRALCLLCAVTYVAVVGLFVVSWRATSVPMTTLPQRAIHDSSALAKSPAALVVIVLLLAGAVVRRRIVSARSARRRREAAQRDRAVIPAADRRTARAIRGVVQRAAGRRGTDRQGTAKVLIVKFNDFQCPPCRQTYIEYKGILSKIHGERHREIRGQALPAGAECNTLNAGHDAACEAAAAFMMATKKGTAEKLETWLFANQGPPHLTRNQVRQAAADIGGITDFDAQYPAVLNEVKADAALGASLGVKSTPTFFINGRRIAGGLPGCRPRGRARTGDQALTHLTVADVRS